MQYDVSSYIPAIMFSCREQQGQFACPLIIITASTHACPHMSMSASCACLHCLQEPELDAQLRKATSTMFMALKGVSYGRCDFRVDGQGGFWPLVSLLQICRWLNSNNIGHSGCLPMLLGTLMSQVIGILLVTLPVTLLT